MQHINLETFANGAFAEQVNRAMEEVAQNIQNPNTDAKKARKITITLTVKPKISAISPQWELKQKQRLHLHLAL